MVDGVVCARFLHSELAFTIETLRRKNRTSMKMPFFLWDRLWREHVTYQRSTLCVKVIQVSLPRGPDWEMGGIVAACPLDGGRSKDGPANSSDQRQSSRVCCLLSTPPNWEMLSLAATAKRLRRYELGLRLTINSTDERILQSLPLPNLFRVSR